MSEISSTIVTIVLGTDITSPGDSAALASSMGGFVVPPAPVGSDPFRNNAYDAFRHAYGSALLSKELTDTISKLGMDNHEATMPIRLLNIVTFPCILL